MKYFKILKNYIWFWQNARKFKTYNSSSLINNPLRISGHRNISIGSNVYINYKTSLVSSPRTGFPDAILEIQDGVIIGNFNHIYSTKKVVIEKNVLTADKVYISDNLHSYEDINTPIMHQPIKQNNEVVIGEGSWIGENACVLGVAIGKNCVIGANCVVTKSVPDYSVVVGIPGKIVKRYDIKTKQWKLTNPDGSFS